MNFPSFPQIYRLPALVILINVLTTSFTTSVLVKKHVFLTLLYLHEFLLKYHVSDLLVVQLT